ncbi:MAG: hypothetical protein CMP76_07550 [Flavobacterium sp.]|uniref:hypothetical protein n=1 Tax=Flavobacterium sp. TaxID=239 RepID=UPI000C66C440|nr:hypothetical protein [Flavobacterium sp.]MBF03136.1 hypothetical protein [Flavobacterium sp.]|tara:strand:- start:540 stop:1442 length:903 start_codon:yes stop_codon:yes gene_type:complete
MKKNYYLFFTLLLVSINVTIAQDYIPYYPTEWEFRNQVDVIDFSQVKSLTTKEIAVDENEEFPILEIYLQWNNTYQLTDYQFVNFNNSYADFDIAFYYVDANSRQLKSVKITNPNTLKTLEDWHYTYGAFDVEKIKVSRYLLNVTQPDVFEVLYEGNDDDYTQETVYNPQKKKIKQTKHWYKSNPEGNTLHITKLYIDDILDQTDSILLNSNGKKLQNTITNLGISSVIKYHYKTRKVDVFGDEFDYQDLDKIQVDGQDKERFEYTFDAKGNWIERKNYKMKNRKWECNTITRRTIEYRN